MHPDRFLEKPAKVEGVQAEPRGLVIGPARVILGKADTLIGVITKVCEEALHLRRAGGIGLAGLLHALGEQVEGKRLSRGRGLFGRGGILCEGRRRQQRGGHDTAQRADHGSAAESLVGVITNVPPSRGGDFLCGHLSFHVVDHKIKSAFPGRPYLAVAMRVPLPMRRGTVPVTRGERVK